ncbi:MAG TPA: exodeoxyribonuclease III [Candidatus Limnocylindrales bacterium]|nr:exodeoxyribonuclease III [Candidatus Limnocylindrales bacterium]
MRIATWNVNSLKARTEAVEKWVAKAQPDVLLMQETKLADGDAPELPFRMLGYELVHHGEGRWNGVAIASKVGFSDVVTNFGDGPVRDSTAGAAVQVGEDDFDPFDEARMVSAVCGGIRFVSLYAPNGRIVGSPFYEGKLRWFQRLRRWLDDAASPDEPLVLGGDLNATPTDDDVWSAARAHGGTHVSPPERAALAALREWGLVDAYRAGAGDARGRFSWWDYRAGNFHRNEGMRIDLLYVTKPVADRIVWAEIDREARKGPPVPSDHAPVVVDLDEAGIPFDAGWDGALARIAARTRPRKTAASGA